MSAERTRRAPNATIGVTPLAATTPPSTVANDLVISHNTSPTLQPIPSSWAGVEIRLVGTDGLNDANMLVDSFGDVGSLGFRRANGTLAAPAPIADGEGIGVVSARGYVPGGFPNERSARLIFRADGAFSSTNAAAKIVFEQILANSLGPAVEVARLHNGGLVVGAPTGGSLGPGSVNAAAFYQNGVALGGAGVAYDTIGSLAAAGSNQATAAPLAPANSFTNITAVAAGAGVILPSGIAGGRVLARNGGANACLCYPGLGGVINNLSANAPIYLQPNSTVFFEAQNATQWFTVP
jgi:hypothetical protein